MSCACLRVLATVSEITRRLQEAGGCVAPLMCHVTLTPTLPPSLHSPITLPLSLILMKCTILRFLFEVHWGESKERGREGGAADKNFVLRLPPAKAARPPGRPPARPSCRRQKRFAIDCQMCKNSIRPRHFFEGLPSSSRAGRGGRGGAVGGEPREPRRGTQDQRGINIMAG